MKKNFAGMAAALLAAVLFFPLRVNALSAESAVLLDAQTGRILYEKDAYARNLIASTTKIMTALVVSEQCNVLDRVRVPAEAVGIEGSSVYLREGEVLTVQELLYCMMLHSGNDAATALAIYCGGTVEGFVQLMNQKAAQLGLLGTHFENPHGLDGIDHYSTAYDLAVLSAYAMENPIFLKTVSARNISAGGRRLRNHNKLLWRLEGAEGVKTGFTKAAGRVLVSSALRQGRRLVAVTIDDPRDWDDHIALIDDGFSHFEIMSVVATGDILGVVEVLSGCNQQVSLVAEDDFAYPIADGEQVEIILQGPGFVYAPVAAGQFAGYAYICINGHTIGKVSLSYGDTVEMSKAEKRNIFDRCFGGLTG